MLKFLIFLSILFHIILAVPQQKATPAISGRVIGGYETTIVEHPYQISLEYLNNFRCGGAIISRTWVLTTGNCVELSTTPSFYKVRVGTSFTGVGGTLLNVKQVIPHKNYLSLTPDYDIALLQLADPVPLSESARVAILPDNGNALIEGSIGNVTGWGVTVVGGALSSVLRATEIPIVSHSVCSDLYSSLGLTVTARMFCAGLWEGGRDACTGDGGGPFVINNVFFGLVSWGRGCADPQRPGVYTHIGVFRDWITDLSGI